MLFFFQEDPNDVDPKRKDVHVSDGEDKAQSVETLPPGIAVKFVMKDPWAQNIALWLSSS